ncbi:hypothetical protein LB467_15965 [Salegentibacter sp. JZCK2]|uniref:hypothetical protein n=1 Tax=Salegentibacter tibetensis TaxID=2873600 RepID=UPI001CCB7119|nr:hypothetical protein [Salegentibacter tibetensis]MBZ9731191.1 hypothetical protein [Salegentibacter tibetensis]
MKYFLDTNIYRNLSRDISLHEVQPLAEKIQNQELKLGVTSGFPIVVAMELIQHLEKTDPEREECFKALCLLFDHSKKYNAKKNTFHGAFFPPLNVILPKYFFNENGPFLDAYKIIIQLTKALTENHDINNIYQFQNEIKAVREQNIFEKKELYDNIIDYLKNLNGGVLDWQYFSKNKTDRKSWFREMQTGKSFAFLAEGLMIRAYGIMNKKYERTDENYALFYKFHNDFFPAIAMTSIILEQIGHGTIAISNVSDHRWNTVLDISMMFGAIFNSQRDNIVFVTEEKKMHMFFKMNNMQDQILKLDEFQKRFSM